MKVTINYGGQLVSVEVSVEVYEFLDCADHKEENLAHEKRRHWDGREFDEHIVFTEGVGVFSELPEDYLCRKETLDELLSVLDRCTETQRLPISALCAGRHELCGNRRPVRLLQGVYL